MLTKALGGLGTAVLLVVNPVAPPMRWTYQWPIIEVLDGDTVKVRANWMPSPLKPEVSIRVAGVDTPELGWKAHCAEEKDLAEKAKAFTAAWIGDGKDVEIEVIAHDKFGGRLLGDFWKDYQQLSRELVRSGLAQYYYGEQKPNWCTNEGEAR